MAGLYVRIYLLFRNAGSETTSNTMAFAMILLLQHPDKLAKLVDEIDQVQVSNDQLPSHEVLKGLPYLDAITKETMRLRPMAALGLPRKTAEDIMLGSYHIPKDVRRKYLFISISFCETYGLSK
jgi:cytochrome P450